MPHFLERFNLVDVLALAVVEIARSRIYGAEASLRK